VRLWRGFPPLLVISLALGCAARPSAALELKLSSSLPEQLPYVYPDLRLTLTNRSASAVFFPASGVHVRVLLEHGDGWVECRPVVVSEPAPTGTVKWEGVAAGGEKAIPVPATRCLCYDTRSTDTCREWTDVPGLYRLKAILSTDAQDQANQSTTSAGAFRGSLESPPVEIVVRQPTGADADAISWANGFSPMTVQVLKKFPTSEYAALVWYGSVRLNTGDPVRTKSLIQRHLYPGPNSVPDPTSPDGWSSLDSEGVARWQIAWGERVVRGHPSFAYRDEVRVLVALAQMSLGMTQEARKTLDAVAANENTFAGGWSTSFLAASANATDSAPTTPPECDWKSGPLGEVVRYGLYLSIMPVDSDWTEAFPLLLLDKQQNYRCMQLLFERGPKVIPGLEAEYVQRAAELAAQLAWKATPLPETGVGIAPALVFLEPVKGREYLIGQIADPRWTFTDVAKMAQSIWPRRSDVVRRALMSRLAKPPTTREGVDLAVSALVRFSKEDDFEFVRSRIDWTEPSTASRLRLSLLSKNGEIAPVVRALRSKVGAEYGAAADALLQWGRTDVVCSHLKVELDPKRANDIAGRYTSFRRGDYFGWLPDDVIASIQKAPQGWECLPGAIKPSPFNAPRETTKDSAARWYRPPLGEDASPRRVGGHSGQ